MTPEQQAMAVQILVASSTLHEADLALGRQLGWPKSFRWGLWDGWAHRPSTFSGLVKEEDTKSKDRGHYLNGVACGERLAITNLQVEQ